MDIDIHGRFHIGMSENHAQRFDIKAALDAARGKGVPQNMKIEVPYAGAAQNGLEMPLHGARFHSYIGAAGNDKTRIVLAQLAQKLGE